MENKSQQTLNTQDITLGDTEITAITENLKRFLTGSLTYKDLMGLKDSHLETIYSIAYDMYNSNKFEKAEELFRGLCLLEPRCHKFWMGLGASIQMQKRLEKAMEVYGIAIGLQAMNPTPLLYVADCALGLKNVEGAVASLELACEVMEKTNTANSKYKDLYAKAQKKLATLKNTSVKK